MKRRIEALERRIRRSDQFLTEAELTLLAGPRDPAFEEWLDTLTLSDLAAVANVTRRGRRLYNLFQTDRKGGYCLAVSKCNAIASSGAPCLAHPLELPLTPPPISPARGPPQGDFLLDQTPAFEPSEAEPVPVFVFDPSLPDEFDH